MSDVSHNSQGRQQGHFEHHVSLNSRVHVRLRNKRLWLLLDHPPLNMLTIEMLEQLSSSLHHALQSTQNTASASQGSSPVLFVITSASDEAFCEGVNAPDLVGERQIRLTQAAAALCTVLGALRDKGIPIIALVKGAAFDAGCELLSLCDTVIAREDARFRLPAPDTHIFPCSVPGYLPSITEQENAAHLSQERKTLDAHEAMQIGLVHQVLSIPRFHFDAEDLLVMLSSVARPENTANSAESNK